MRRIVHVFACAFSCAAACAAEPSIHDIRLGIAYGVAQNPTYEIATKADGDVDAGHLRVSLGYLASVSEFEHGAIFVGAALFHESSEGDGEGELAGTSVDTRSLGVDLEGGYAYRVAAVPGLDLESALLVGFLQQGVSIGGAVGSRYDIAETGFEVAVRVGAEYAVDASWRVGFDVRWLLDGRSEGTVAGVDSTYKNEGLSLGLNVGYRL
jgi:hypothetical protein